MEYTRLGTTGLEVSRICLGMMSFGDSSRGGHTWVLPEEESRTLIKKAVDAGITFFDTANVYSAGSSEEITGRALADFAQREDVVIATKVHGRMRPGPNGAGLSRKAIVAELDASLRRLGTDYVDLYQIHRWDPSTPIEETLEALDACVRSGKVRYLGASSMWAWQFSKALHLAGEHGWHRFVSMQDHYNLLNREEEREMLPLCADQSIAVLPWSPLARGRLTRDWDESTERSEIDDFGRKLYDTLAVIGRKVEGGSDKLEGPAQQDALKSMARWPVTLSYFTQGKGEQTPVYVLSFDLYENGVSRALRLDYGDFALKGDMQSLELLPDKGCQR